ncbi:MAG TPA: hypothetical protein PK637_09110, partial [Flavobacteriales bacterium]|nr:hypothetical protein [Flavobacteriales bacterium]
IRGNSDVFFNGKIVGFSDRINTILVPLDFLRYSNLNFQTRQPTSPSRLILAVTDLSHPGIARMMEEKGYDTNQENLKGSRVKTILLVVLVLFLFIGGVIVVLSILTFIQYGQILISRVNYELRVLLLMGYDHTKLANHYLGYVMIWLAIIFLSAIGLLYLAEIELLKYLKEYELSTQPGISLYVWLAAFGLILVYTAINAWSIRINLRRLAKNLQG